MGKNLARYEKIRLLKAVEAGIIRPQDLQPNKFEVWFFNGQDIFTHYSEGKEIKLSGKEFEKVQAIKSKNISFLIWKEVKTY
ncbi:MAG TPA: hypothetical protein PLC62_00760 [Chitinophagaceae bacterium]|jgi:hypothetical protein|nr:hypothetical protein [Chitinophagaceae bacterium]HNJ25065.1 hypothetical protein [Chitinophagaceae bacterium]HNJ54939.1 hypothetical protein [Chitinophagaceae bacterium]